MSPPVIHRGLRLQNMPGLGEFLIQTFKPICTFVADVLLVTLNITKE